MVEHLSSPGGGKLQPKNEGGLDREVPGEVVEDDTKGDALEESEEAENDPVSQPLDVIVMSGALDSDVGQISRECPSNEVRDGQRKGVDEDEKKEGDDAGDGAVCFRYTSPVLHLDEERVLAELCIKLGNVLDHSLLSLLHHGVSLNLLRGTVESSLGVLNSRMGVL